MKKFLSWGNDLHSGRTSIPFVGRAKLWLTIAGVIGLLSVAVPLIFGFNLGIAFRGGSEFQVAQVDASQSQAATDAVTDAVGDVGTSVVPTSDTSVRITTEQLTDPQMQEVRDALVEVYDVQTEDVAMIFMAIYFRTWKMSIAAIIGLIAVMVVTIGIYSATGFEITPEAIIGFLTVLSFSLYDTVVVFDKIRENTQDFEDNVHMKFSELVNLGVNQTTVRSINTSVIAVLPIASILFIGVVLLGAGTLTDISLSLFIGTIVAALSTLFVASPLYAVLRRREAAVRKQEAAVEERRQEKGLPDRAPVLGDEVPVSAGR
jgi:preprotein translocase subunit SecF